MACGWQNSCRPWSCNYLQNAGATTYKNFLQFYAKKACKKHFGTCVNPAGNVIFKALLLPLFTENEDGAFTLSTDSQGAIKALSAVVHNVAKA